jgi:peptidoglycan hydrolase-like protein with peptidoglycan-binding domain
VRRKPRELAAAAVLAAVIATAGMVALSGGKGATSAAQDSPANTVSVEKGRLSDMVSQDGTLTYRGRYSAINQASGTYTQLPGNGDKVGCGDVLYRVDNRPVLLLCGTVPAYRDLGVGRAGKDVRQLNRNLHELGYDADPGDGDFTAETANAVEQLQEDKGLDVTGALDIGGAVFLPQSARISQVTGDLGGPAQPGSEVAQATSDTLEVQANLEPSQQGEVKAGNRAQITLPGNKSVTGTVDRVGRVAQPPAAQGQTSADATAATAVIPVYIGLDEPDKARGLDEAPVQVNITTRGVKSALSVPVLALLGRSGGGYAVEVVRDDGQHDLVAVELGLFDTAKGRVQVEGDLHEGDQVVVPSL